jgi:ferrous iron transport protein A
MLLHRKDNNQKEETCENPDEVPLICLKEGAKGIVTRTSGGLGVVRRLSDLGLTPGCKIKLIRKCSFRGPVEIEARGVTLALGYGLSSKILVQPLKAQENEQ